MNVGHDDGLPYCSRKSRFVHDPCTISVQELQVISQRHLRDRTWKNALTEVDSTSNVFIATKFSGPGIQLGKRDRGKQHPRPRIIEKTYGTQLHYACRDTNGARGERKIKMILESAEIVGASFPCMFTVREATAKLENGKWATNDNYTNHEKTPLYILLENEFATPGSIRLVVAKCPAILSFRHVEVLDEGDVYCYNPLLYFMDRSILGLSNYQNKEDNARDLAVVEVLIHYADNTSEGARALVSANLIQNNYLYDTDQEEPQCCNSINLLISHRLKQISLLTPLIKKWPDALKYCCDVGVSDGYCSFPLHTIWDDKYNRLDFSTKVKATEALLGHSTIDAVSVALLQTNFLGNLGFHAVMNTMPKNMSTKEEGWKDRLDQFLKTLPYKKDGHGRMLLHYVAAFRYKPNPREVSRARGMFQSRISRSQETSDWELDSRPDELEAWEKEKTNLEERNERYKLEVIQWILKDDPSLAFVCDRNGHNPFHFAIISGKTWGKGLSNLATLVPQWPRQKTKCGLVPYQLAATLVNDCDGEIDTMYELLKFVGTIAT